MKIDDLRIKLIDKGLKITPQRLVILGAITEHSNHPAAENIIEHIRKSYPNVAIATVYKVLDTLVENRIIRKVMTEKGIMRYDAIMGNHHHLYSSESDRIEDYSDKVLSKMLSEYFKHKRIPDFEIEDIRLQIIGKFRKSGTQ